MSYLDVREMAVPAVVDKGTATSMGDT